MNYNGLGRIYPTKLRFPNIAQDPRCLKTSQNTSIADTAAITRWPLKRDRFLGPQKPHYSGTSLYFQNDRNFSQSKRYNNDALISEN